jgi:hypothetical protein
MTSERNHLQLAIVIAVTAVVLNTAFWFISDLYYADRPDELVADAIDRVRIAFAIFSVVVSGASFVAALAPREIGHVIAITQGIASLYSGVWSLVHELPLVAGAMSIAFGVLLPVLAWLSWAHRSRPAWAFLVAMLVVLAIVSFFGSPKVSNLAGAGLWTVMMVPGLLAVAVVALAMIRADYRQGAPSR